jgi:hypothetical protein
MTWRGFASAGTSTRLDWIQCGFNLFLIFLVHFCCTRLGIAGAKTTNPGHNGCVCVCVGVCARVCVCVYERFPLIPWDKRTDCNECLSCLRSVWFPNCNLCVFNTIHVGLCLNIIKYTIHVNHFLFYIASRKLYDKFVLYFGFYLLLFYCVCMYSIVKISEKQSYY